MLVKDKEDKIAKSGRLKSVFADVSQKLLGYQNNHHLMLKR